MPMICRTMRRREPVSRFSSCTGITWPVVYDHGDKLTTQFRLFGQPTTFVINGHGVVVDRINGKTSEKSLGRELSPLVQS